MVPLAYANRNAISDNTDIWVVNALVDATAISGPAGGYAPASVSLAIDEPTTLQSRNTKAPFSFASLIAAKVSAVSPDCGMEITTSSALMIGFLYRNSEAYSTSTGIRAN